MTGESDRSGINPKFLLTAPSVSVSPEGKPTASFMVANNIQSTTATQKSDNFINNKTTVSNGSGNNIPSREDTVASSTRDTIVVLVTLTVIFFTLAAAYFLWRKHRRGHATSSRCKLEEYRYSRLNQNDVEVDNISFQGDLTDKTLSHPVPVCAEDDCEDDNVRPATLCLEYDSLITISNDDCAAPPQQEDGLRRTSTSSDCTAPVNLLMDELSDEDLLQ